MSGAIYPVTDPAGALLGCYSSRKLARRACDDYARAHGDGTYAIYTVSLDGEPTSVWSTAPGVSGERYRIGAVQPNDLEMLKLQIDSHGAIGIYDGPSLVAMRPAIKEPDGFAALAANARQAVTATAHAKIMFTGMKISLLLNSAMLTILIAVLLST